MRESVRGWMVRVMVRYGRDDRVKMCMHWLGRNWIRESRMWSDNANRGKEARG